MVIEVVNVYHNIGVTNVICFIEQTDVKYIFILSFNFEIIWGVRVRVRCPKFHSSGKRQKKTCQKTTALLEIGITDIT